MTEEERAKADADYDALPGTPPDRRSFRSNAEIGDRDAGAVLAEMLERQGGKFHRMTKTDDGLWAESWDEHPYKQAAFQPGNSVAPATQDERMTVPEAIYLIVELKRMAARLGHEFEASDRRLADLGFSVSDRNAIFGGVTRNMRATSADAIVSDAERVALK